MKRLFSKIDNRSHDTRRRDAAGTSVVRAPRKARDRFPFTVAAAAVLLGGAFQPFRWFRHRVWQNNETCDKGRGTRQIASTIRRDVLLPIPTSARCPPSLSADAHAAGLIRWVLDGGGRSRGRVPGTVLPRPKALGFLKHSMRQTRWNAWTPVKPSISRVPRDRRAALHGLVTRTAVSG